ncbi:MAG TPA: hypothetical protein VFH27_04520 [Longimicrobiaceae bacterium]|nr:hypothetical protein [Longimicrobiaceae bacterium]
MNRPARGTLRRLLLCAAAAGLVASGLAAQQTTPPPPPPRPPAPADTLPRTRRDTAIVSIPQEARSQDTLPDKHTRRDSLPADSLRPGPNFPAWPTLPSGGWQGTWTLTRADLEHYHGLSLIELLERVPGLLMIRTGSVGQPLALSPYALGGGRLRVYLDGFELVPIGTSGFDLQRLQLIDLQSLRVERALSGTRIDVLTFQQPDRRPFAAVEAGDGDFSTRILRGFFTRALGERDQVQGTFDLISTDGFSRQGPFDITTFGGRYSHLFAPDRGIQLEFRKQRVDRDQPGATRSSVILPFPESVDRSDLIVRARSRFGSRLWVDAFGGRTRVDPAPGDTTSVRGSASQAGARAALVSSFGTLNGEARIVRGTAQSYSPNETDLTARLDLTPLPWLAATGQVRSLTLNGVVGVETEASARIGPAAGFTAFATLSAGKRPLQFARDSVITRRAFTGLGTDSLTTISDTSFVFATRSGSLTGLRLGGEFNRGTVLLGAAALRVDPSQIAGFGLGFDAAQAPIDASASNGVEVYGSLPLYFPWLRADGWFVRMQDAGDRPFLPTDYGAASLQYHNTFFTGNLEPTARIEAVMRGPAAVPDSIGGLTGVTERYALFNIYLQVRVIDVSIFVRAENLVNRRTAQDVPGFRLPGYRALYGFRWFFRN